MSNYRIVGSRLLDPVTNALVGFVDGNGGEVPLSSIAGGGGSGTPVQLSGNYTLTAADSGTIFYAAGGTTWTVTVPGGLTPMPLVSFIPPATGSITLSPSGSQIAGSTSPVTLTATNAPAGAGLIPQLGQTDHYGLTSLLAGTWSGLTGAPTDSSAFNTWAAANVGAPDPVGTKKSAAYTIAAADHHSSLFLTAQSADKTITLPAGLPTNFKMALGYINTTAAAGRLIIAPGSGVVVNYYAQDPETSNGGSPAGIAPFTFQNNTTRANIFMGKASANSQAWCWLVAEGVNADTYNMIGQVGKFATA